jgi:hypothetical protein
MTKRFAQLLGHSAIDLWPDLPRKIQEGIFERAARAD